MEKKRTTVVLLLVLTIGCSSLSLVPVRRASSSAGLWTTAEFNMLQVRNQAIHYYQGVRLLYDLARQVQGLQEQEDAFGRSPASAVHHCSMRLPTSFNKAVPESPGWLAVKRPSGQIQ